LIQHIIGTVGVANATFSNISAISLRSVLLVEETGVPEENNRPAASHRLTFSHNVASNTPALVGFNAALRSKNEDVFARM